MTHEQHAKKFITNLYLSANGYMGPTEHKKVDEFFRHLKEAVKADIRKKGIYDRGIT